MTLRCKEGDLALIVHDERGCESNIGRVVEVRGPVMLNSRLELMCWLIRPTVEEPWCCEIGGRMYPLMVDWSSNMEHPDAWMIPLRLPEEDQDHEESLSEDEGIFVVVLDD